MLIDAPTRSLGVVDIRRLTERVSCVDESAWWADNRRQDEYEVHAQTQSIILVFFTGWPAVQVAHAGGWEAFHDVAMPVIDHLVGRHYPPGGMILRAVLARLPPGCRIDNHIDSHPSFSIAHRIHVPLMTHRDVEFVADGARIVTAPGHAFELNNKMAHSVTNSSGTPRIHLIFDYAPD